MPISDLKITPGATGGNAISIPNTPAPKTLSTPAPNSNIVDDKALQNTVSPAVITSKNAANDLVKIKTNVADINTGIQTQAQKLAAAKVQADADAALKKDKETQAAKDKTASDQAAEALRLKNAALNGGTPTPPAPTIPTDTTFTNQINRAPDQVKTVTTNGDGTRTVSYHDGTVQIVAKDPNTPLSAPTSTDDLSAQRVADAQKTFDTITGIQNGTIPLSDGENAQIEGLKLQFQKLISDQNLTNTGASGVANIRGYQTGSAEYDNSFQTKIIGSIITAGANKIADLNIKMASAVATLTQSFKDNDINKIKEAYTILDNAKKDRQATIQKTIDDTTKATQQAFDNAEKVKKDNLDALIHSDEVSYKEKQQAIDTSRLSETVRHDLQTELTAREVALKGTFNRDADGTIYDTRTGKVVSQASDSQPIGAVTPGSTGNPLLDANTKYTQSGVPYIDGTNLSGSQSTSIQLAAAKMGIPFLSKEGASAINNISAAKNDFKLISDYVDKLNPSVSLAGVWRLAVSAVHGLESITQSGPGADDIASYKAFKESAIKAIQALAAGGTGLRINQAEIETMMGIIPSYNDTKGVAQGKLIKLNAMLNNNEKGMIGSKYYDNYVPEEAKKDVDAYMNVSPEHKTQVEGLLKQFPSLTDSQVLQLVQP